MKFFAMTLFISMFGSSALAECPERFPTGRQAAQALANYDRTCTLVNPRLVDRGVGKTISGSLDDVCFQFGFGIASGVDFQLSGLVPPAETSIVLGETATGQNFSTVTCRLPGRGKPICERLPTSSFCE